MIRMSQHNSNSHHAQNHEHQHHNGPLSYGHNSHHKMILEIEDYQFYAIVLQMIIGLTANVTIICSMAITLRRHRSDLTNRRRQQPIPVVDIIFMLISVESFLRIIFRSVIQLGCFYGLCINCNDIICYLQGFLITFIHYVHLWTMALFIQDRYIKHYKQQNDYLCKCTHMVLYLTMSCVTFLVTLHLCAPIYGFSSYRFLQGELTCAVDWSTRHSCPFYIYSLILVSGPAAVPIIYWTLKITYRSYFRCCSSPSLCTTNISHHSHPHVPIIRFTKHPTEQVQVSSLSQQPLSPVDYVKTKKSQINIQNSTDSHIQSISSQCSSNSVCSTSSAGSIPTLSPRVEVGCPTKSSFSTSDTTVAICSCPSPTKIIMSNSPSLTSLSKQISASTSGNKMAHNENNNYEKDKIVTTTSAKAIIKVARIKNRKRTNRKRDSTKSQNKDISCSSSLGPTSLASCNIGVGGKIESGDNGDSLFSSSSSSHLSCSIVLNKNNELLSVAICSWIFIIGYLLKLFNDSYQACFHSNHVIHQMEKTIDPSKTTSYFLYLFFIAYIDEISSTVLIPLVMLSLHRNLRTILYICLECLRCPLSKFSS